MRNHNRRPFSILVALFLVALITILALPAVLADGDTRKATQAEKDFNRQVLTAFAKALPPGPAGWDQAGETTVIKDLDNVTAGIDSIPLQVGYVAGWQDTKKIQENEAKYNEALMKLAQGPPEKITEQAIQDLEKQYVVRDAKVRVDLTANLTSISIYEKIAPAASIAGGLVYRSNSEYKNSSWREGSTYVFLGKGWKFNNSGGTWFDFPANKKLPRTVTQSIMVKVQADAARAQQILEQIDWASLTKLIKN